MEVDASGIQLDTLESGAVTEETMNTFPVVIGASGRRYRAVNLLTELTTRHLTYLSECLAPVYPLAAQLVGYGIDALQGGTLSLTRAEVIDAMQNVKLSEAWLALAMTGVEMRFFVGLYLPEDDRRFPDREPSEEFERIIAERIDDLDDIEPKEMLTAFAKFFTSNFSFAQTDTLMFIYSLMKKARRMRMKQNALSSSRGLTSP